MEAIACKRPVIITNNIGLGREFIDKELVFGVAPVDAADLKQKIIKVMNDSNLANNYAEKAHDYLQRFHTSGAYTEVLTNKLEKLAEEQPR